MNVKKMDKNLELCDDIKFNIEESSSSLPLPGTIVKKKNIKNDDCHRNDDDDDVDVGVDIDNGELLNNNNKNGICCKDIKNVCHHNSKDNHHAILVAEDNIEENHHQRTDNSVNLKSQELSENNHDDEKKLNRQSLSDDDDSVNAVDQQSTNNSTDNLSYLSDNNCIIEEIYLSDDELSKNSDDCIYAYRGGADYVDLTNDNRYGIACGIGLNVGNVGSIGGGGGGGVAGTIGIPVPGAGGCIGIICGIGGGSNNGSGVGIGIGGGNGVGIGGCANGVGGINNHLNNSNNHDDETDFLEMDFEPDPSSELEQNDYHHLDHHHHHLHQHHHHHIIDCSSNDYNNEIIHQNKCHNIVNNDSSNDNDIKIFPNLLLDSKINNEHIMNTNNQTESSVTTEAAAAAASSTTIPTMKYSEFEFKMTGAKRKKVFDKISTLPSSSSSPAAVATKATSVTLTTTTTTETSPKTTSNLNKLNSKYQITDDNIIIISDSSENSTYSSSMNNKSGHNNAKTIDDNDCSNNCNDNNDIDDDDDDNKCLDCVEKEFLIKTIGKNSEIIEIRNQNHKKCSKCNISSSMTFTKTLSSSSSSSSASSYRFDKNNFYNVVNECHHNDKNSSSFDLKSFNSNNSNSATAISSSSSDKNQKIKSAFQIMDDSSNRLIPNNNMNRKLKHHKDNTNNYCGHIVMDDYQKRLLLDESTIRENNLMENLHYYHGGVGNNSRKNVKFSNLNVNEETIVQALDKLNIAYDKNLILEYFNNINDTQTHENISDVPDLIVHISKKNCDYKRIIRVIRMASKDKIHIQFIPNSNRTSSSSASLSLSEIIDVSVHDILQYWNHNNDLGKLKKLKNKRFIEMNVLGKIINLIRQAQQKNTKQLSGFIKIPQYYKTGYICITKD